MRYIPKTVKVKHKIYKNLGYIDMGIILSVLLLIAAILSRYSKARLGICIVIAIATFVALIRIEDRNIYLYAIDGIRYLCSKKKVYEEVQKTDRSYVEIEGINFLSCTRHHQEEMTSLFKRLICKLGNFRISKLNDTKKYRGQIETYQNLIEELGLNLSKGLMTQEEYEIRKNIAEGVIEKLNKREEREDISPRYFLSFEGDSEEVTKEIRAMGLKSIPLTEAEYIHLAFPEHQNEAIYAPSSYQTDQGQYSWQTISSLNCFADIGFGIELFNSSGNVFLDIRKGDRNKCISRIDKAIFEMRSRKTRRRSEDIDCEKLELALDETLASIKNNDDVFELTVTFQTVDEKGKKENRKANVKEMSEYGHKVRREIFKQKQVGDSIRKNKPLKNREIIIDATTLSYIFPFEKKEIEENGGIYINSETPNFIDFFKRDSRHINSNLVILGVPGSGKSYSSKEMLINLAVKDTKIMILDIEGEYKKLTNYLAGHIFSIDRRIPFNPFDIGDIEVDSLQFTMHMEFLKDLYESLFQTLDDKERKILLSATREAFRTSKDVTFAEVLKHIDKKDLNENITSAVATLQINEDGNKNSRCVCFDFTQVFEEKDSGLFNAYLMLTIKHIEQEIFKNIEYNHKHKCNRKLIILIDESHVLLDECRKEALDFIYLLSKRIRKYEGMMMLVTQSIKDFQSEGKYEKKTMSPLTATQYAMIFRTSQGERREVENMYISEKWDGLCDISSLRRGEMVFVGGINELSVIEMDKSEREEVFKIWE